MYLPALASTPALLPARGVLPDEERGAIRDATKDKDVVLIGGYEDNGAVATEAAAVHQAVGPTELWTAGRHDRVLPYDDGAGQRVNYTYDRINTQAALSYRPTERSRLTLYGMRDNFTDSRLPAYGVDTPRFARWIGSGTAELKPSQGVFDRVEAGANVTVISYLADNYSLRDQPTLGLSQDATWVYYRGLTKGEFVTGDFQNEVSLDGNLQNFKAVINNHFLNEGLGSYRLPDVTIARAGLTLSTFTNPTPVDRLSAGLRADFVQSYAGQAHETPSVVGTSAASFNRSPQQLWDTYYGGSKKNNPTDINLSGRLRYDHTLDAASKLYAEGSRLVRTPDPGERFFGSSGPASLIQVGNPELAPEAHHKFELGGEQGLGGWSGYLVPTAKDGSSRLAASFSFDRVMDFITIDHAHGQPGIAMSDSGIIYRNVEAYLGSATMQGWWQVLDGLGARARLSWTQGQNLTDHRPLYQVPPLEGDVVVEHRRSLWDMGTITLGTRLGFAATQHQVDASTVTGSGQDTGGKSPGYAVVDLFTGLTMENGLGLSAGIGNILDKRYHLHINPVPQSTTTLPQRAPGRSFFLMSSLAF